MIKMHQENNPTPLGNIPPNPYRVHKFCSTKKTASLLNLPHPQTASNIVGQPTMAVEQNYLLTPYTRVGKYTAAWYAPYGYEAER